jgi:4'-phosphopantetheinyl transferase EntD
MMGKLLPAAVVVVEAFGEPDDSPLFPAEAAAVARAVDKRRREYAGVRACARTALAGLGRPPVPIVAGFRGAPQWPPGVVGSMTHCAGYRAAAVAPAADVYAVGIDAEPAEPLPGDVVTSIVRPAERVALSRLARQAPAVPWDRLLFSAKESAYKAWFPLTGRWLDFTEAEVDFSEAEVDFAARSAEFSVRLLVPGPVVGGRRLDRFAGRWAMRHGLVATAVAVR